MGNNSPKAKYTHWVVATNKLINQNPNIRTFMNNYFGTNENHEIVNHRMVTVIDTSTHKYGMAFCNPEDEYDIGVGKAIAYCRLMGIKPEYPPKIVEIGTLKNGDKCYIDNLPIIIVGECPTNKNHMVYTYLRKSINAYVYAEVCKTAKVCIE